MYRPIHEVVEAQTRVRTITARVRAAFDHDVHISNEEWHRLKIVKCPQGRCEKYCDELFSRYGDDRRDSWWWQCADCHMETRIKLDAEIKAQEAAEKQERERLAYVNRTLTPAEIRQNREIS